MKNTNVKSLDLWAFPLRGGGKASRATNVSESRARDWQDRALGSKRERWRLMRAAVVAFTMAEILLSLTIIGVVAAITLPSLTGNINERTWNTQRKALYARMSQAISLMPALNGYGTLIEGDDSTSAQDNAAETFITAGLTKVLKINNICDNQHLEDCGIVTSFTNLTGSKISTPPTLYELNSHFKSASYGYWGASYSTINTKAAAFETQNGENIITYYNRSCRSEALESLGSKDIYGHFNMGHSFSQSNMCLNFIYDLNGKKGPNTVGKDIGFMTIFNATAPTVVAPMPSPPDNTKLHWRSAIKICSNKGTRMPNKEELGSMLINKELVDLSVYKYYWSSSSVNSYQVWTANIDRGTIEILANTNELAVRCIKR